MANFGVRRLDPVRSVEIIESLGGTTRVARLFGISAPSVTEWKKLGIPEYRLLAIQLNHPKNPAVRKSLDFRPCSFRH